jgi:hypothetical protein
MRKRRKKKKCGRWKEKDLAGLKEFEQTKMAGE